MSPGVTPAVATNPAAPTGLHIVEVSTADLGAVAAQVVADHVHSHPRGVLGIATGSSPLHLYAALARRRSEGLATEGLTLAALDEYVGVDPGDPRSYYAYALRHVARPLGVPAARLHVPSGSTQDDAHRYEDTLRGLGGVGLQIVGIGRNGHIGFNEPGSSRGSRTRVVPLADDTRAANARYFDGHLDAVPTSAITQGIATILAAERIVMVASGAQKAPALHAALHGPVTTGLPASFLQTHRSVTVVADHDALGTRP